MAKVEGCDFVGVLKVMLEPFINLRGVDYDVSVFLFVCTF